MGSEAFQYRIARVWLKKPLSIEEILEKLSVKPLLMGALNFTGIRGQLRILVRIRSGTAVAARKLDIFADTNVDKGLQNAVEGLLPVFTRKELAEEGRAIIEKQRDEDDLELWERDKNQLMHIVLDLCDHPFLRKERDRRITREIGFPAYFEWVSKGRDPEDRITELSRKMTGQIVRELADGLMSFPPSGDPCPAKDERYCRKGRKRTGQDDL